MRALVLVVIGLMALAAIIAGTVLLCLQQSVPPPQPVLPPPKPVEEETRPPPCCPPVAQVVQSPKFIVEVPDEEFTVEVRGPIRVEVVEKAPPEVPKEERKPEVLVNFTVGFTIGNYLTGLEMRILPSPVGGAVSFQPVEEGGFLIGARLLVGTPAIYAFAGLGYAYFPWGSGIANYVAGGGLGMFLPTLSLYLFGELGWVWAICDEGPYLQWGLGLAF